ncbi:MAG: NAD(P)-dependent oxidoreductase [Alphaproteobacteria bacterium]|nr:NAD(P)-dependent oxidoreductase [Alphaproteobacteria bacterium]MCZ6591364.1 NAD(P)-dependent oxidoreductase [Alphaproteobacteria bacterium]MCZ6846340.1 NAD(P)-dependent oxidoreductase [Alphaproteobacteria bacterium]
MAAKAYGFIGLGNMGAPMCGHLCAAGLSIICYDAAGTSERAPEGAEIATDLAAVVAVADTIFLSLPDGPVVSEVADEIVATAERRATTVVDLSTTGPDVAVAVGASLAEAGIVFVDAPVSGGRSGAVAATLALMCAGPDEAVAALETAFEAIAGNVFQVGKRPGQAQAMKLLNNFLSATAMAATTEAILFGAAHGLEMNTMLAVLNVSSGRNTATGDKFPNRVATGTFDAGFATALMSKDVALYREQVGRAGTPDSVADVVSRLWRETETTLPGSDFTEIYRYLADR